MELDRFSDLPRNVIDQILSLLPVKDAARTSILSTKWKHKWAELPFLVFTCLSMPVFLDNLEARSNEFVRIVDRVLLHHIGPILKFKLFSFYLQDYTPLDRWISHLSRFSIKELHLYIFAKDYSVPSSLFSCQSLAVLVLFGCSIRPSSTYKGFPKLKTLHLSDVDLAKDVFENLISNCPVLERLVVFSTLSAVHVTINVPNLQFCFFHANLEGISFVNTSRLTDVCLSRRDITGHELQGLRNSSNLLNFSLQLPMIQRLDIDTFFLKYLAVGVEPGKPSISCVSLDDLALKVDLGDHEDCKRALSFSSIFPNLTKLRIKVGLVSHKEETVAERETNFRGHDCRNRLFNKLHFIKINGDGISGTRAELSFVEFMLLNSPVLERMVVMTALGGSQLELQRNLLRLRCASERTRIICLPR